MQSSSSIGRKRARWRRYLVWYAFIAPNVILFAIFGLLPILATVLISFTRWNVLGTPTWVGLQNFQRLLQDDEFWTTLRVTATYAILFVLPSASIALGQAMLVALAGRWQALFRTIYFIPVVTSITVIAMIWGWLFLPDENGPLNYLIGIVGIPPQSWLQSLTQALPSVTLVAIWSAVGYYMVLWLSGLQGIPQELLDAAMVDGANAWTRFWSVTLPLLRPTTMFIIVIGTINAFQAFALFYLLTGGGPLYETTTIVLFIYKNAFRLQEMGYASAASMILVLVTLITTLIQRRAIGGWSDELYS
jgi:ABC-type sugar transport system permease subunit